MMRVLFWIFVAGFLGAFFWFASASKYMTANQNLAFWESATSLVMVAFAAYAFCMLFYGVKRRAVILASKYGGREFSRDTQPFRYWCGMLFYCIWLLVMLFCLYRTSLELLHLL
jgi:hypothetical protein